MFTQSNLRTQRFINFNRVQRKRFSTFSLVSRSMNILFFALKLIHNMFSTKDNI